MSVTPPLEHAARELADRFRQSRDDPPASRSHIGRRWQLRAATLDKGQHMLAYDFPLLSITLLICWWPSSDLLRRDLGVRRQLPPTDTSGWAKAGFRVLDPDPPARVPDLPRSRPADAEPIT
jgi:hypothetical protein